MGLFYLVLFIYCYFSIIAYTYFPEKASIINHVSANGTQFFWFKAYIATSFAFFNIFYFLIFRRYRENTVRVKNNNSNYSRGCLYTSDRKPRKVIFILIVTFFALYLGYFLVLNFSQLSYYSQSILKSNKIVYLMFDYCFIFVFVCYLTYKKFRKSFYGKVSLIIGTLISLIFILLSLKIGSRGTMIQYSIAIIYYICEKNHIKLKFSYLKQILKIAFVLLLIIWFSQLVRGTRGGVVDFSNVDLSFAHTFNFFDFEELVFQDYVTPAATLLHSMNENIVIPGTVIMSEILNIPVILDYVTLSEYFSRLVSPSESWGIGYYILTWGYNVFGFIGCIIAPIFLIIAYKQYYRVFFYTGNPDFSLFIRTVIVVYLVLPIVRGQMYPFIKHIYVYFIPAIFIYCIAMGVKIKLKRIQIT